MCFDVFCALLLYSFLCFFVVFCCFVFLQEQSRTGTHQPEQEQEHTHQSALFGLRKYIEYIWLDMISSHS